MVRLMVRPQAYEDLEEIVGYIGTDNPDAGYRFLLAAQAAFHTLAAMPLLGTAREVRNARLGGMRTYLVPQFRKYLVIYQATPEGVEILRVVHGARDLDRLLEDEEP
jgi:toxin ParE1/3/4